MSIPARFLTTLIAGTAGYAAVGIYSLLGGSAQTASGIVAAMLLFTAVYVPGVFGARRMLVAVAREIVESPVSQAS